jgi:hypothetical protein
MQPFHFDRVRVARVQIVRGQDVYEVPECWISIYPDEAVVGIWMGPEEQDPMLRVPLENAVIEWPELEVPM